MPTAPAQTVAAAPAAPAAIVSKSNTPAAQQWSLGQLFGWKRLDGTVIYAGMQQMGRMQREWWETALKLVFMATLVIVFGTTALVILIGLAVLSLIWSVVFPQRSQTQQRQGFFSGLMSQVASYFIFSRLFGPAASTPVCDYRLRDHNGTESLVRIEGYVRQGALGIGDDVIAEGFIHRGTLVLRRGYNKRLNCAIRVKRQ